VHKFEFFAGVPELFAQPSVNQSMRKKQSFQMSSKRPKTSFKKCICQQNGMNFFLNPIFACNFPLATQF
jgi:hypothetical protein